jgi:hypothetical protein
MGDAGDAGDARDAFFGDAFLGVLSGKRPQAPAKLLGQIQRVCEWKAFIRGFFIGV